MRRRKPASTKQRKAQLQLKRAVKRGDAPPPDAQDPSQTQKPNHPGKRTDNTAVPRSRQLQSRFLKPTPDFLEKTKFLASIIALPRPIGPEAAIFDDRAMFLGENSDSGTSKAATFTLPKRPKWKFDMTKVQVEKNEEGMFNKWLAHTDTLVGEWMKGDDDIESQDSGKPVLRFPRSTPYFERNIEAWRQLWRVTEISQVILILLDSRCPLLHYPPSLQAYLSGHKVILVLTKVDMSGPTRTEAWTAYFRTRYPGLRVVPVESYVEKETGTYHQGGTIHKPRLSDGLRHRLVHALKEVHAEMLVPPERIRQDKQKLARWRCPVNKYIDWEGLLRSDEQNDKAGTPEPQLQDEGDKTAHTLDPDSFFGLERKFLTIGLIGQPNVGKSSLVNALFNIQKVRASKTPGKTKHFQTLFWTSDVRLVDCPGLVFPNIVPMEMQVLCGILPISRVSAISTCVHYVAQRLPLEQIYDLTHPTFNSLQVEDKRTWRDGIKPSDKLNHVTWTTTDLLIRFAESKGWVTAKAGRPDVNRAGNAILRALAEGRIGWAFWPPGTVMSTIMLHGNVGAGIWIPHINVTDEECDDETEDEQPDVTLPSDEVSADEDSEDVTFVPGTTAGIGRFGVLSPDEGSSDNEE